MRGLSVGDRGGGHRSDQDGVVEKRAQRAEGHVAFGGCIRLLEFTHVNQRVFGDAVEDAGQVLSDAELAEGSRELFGVLREVLNAGQEGRGDFGLGGQGAGFGFDLGRQGRKFGGADGKTLFITAGKSLYSVHLNIATPINGDYNGNACAGGRLFMAWASATDPSTGTAGNLRIFSDAAWQDLDYDSDQVANDQDGRDSDAHDPNAHVGDAA